MTYTDSQIKLIAVVRAALSCGGDCSDYCCGCKPDKSRYIKWAAKNISTLSPDILQAAQI